MADPTSVFGYPVKTAKELGLEDAFKRMVGTAGMAWGGGENASPKEEPRTLVSNPFNPTQSDPLARAGLFMIEAARHRMSEQGYQPKFPLSQEQKNWQAGIEGPYRTDSDALKKSILSRIVAGDVVPGITQTQQVEADTLSKDLWSRDAAAGNVLMKYLQSLQR